MSQYTTVSSLLCKTVFAELEQNGNARQIAKCRGVKSPIVKRKQR
jgi:hypothetical protein